MSSRKPPKTPHGLGSAGRRLWREVHADLHESMEFDAKDVQVLERAAVLADLVEVYREDLRTRGPVVEGSTGRSMTNPSIDKIGVMQARITLMLSRIRLDPPAPKTRHLSRAQRNRLRDLDAGRGV